MTFSVLNRTFRWALALFCALCLLLIPLSTPQAEAAEAYSVNTWND